MIKINFYGLGIRYWLCEIPNAEFDHIKADKEKNGMEWVDLFFNLEYLESKGYSNWESIHLLEEGKGWLMQDRNTLEIKRGRKKRSISMNEFLGNGVLFDAYKKEYNSYKLKKRNGFTYVLLLQKETGTINRYQLDGRSINTDELKFTFTDARDMGLDLVWLTQLEYQGKELFDQGDDSLIRESLVKVI